MSTILERKAKQLVERTAISDWLPYEAWDDANQVYRLDDGRIGVVFASKPLLGLSEESIQKLTNLLSQTCRSEPRFNSCSMRPPLLSPIWTITSCWRNEGRQENAMRPMRERPQSSICMPETHSLSSNPPLRPRDFTVYVSVAFPTQETTSLGWEDERISSSGVEY